MIKINNLISTRPVETKTVFFGGGEKHIQLLNFPSAAEIIVNFENDSDIVTLAMYVDALKRSGCKSMVLKIPYFPGARQDRVCNEGEALSVKVYADLINAMKFDRVVIFDPHSEVTPALLDNVEAVDNHVFVDDCVDRLIVDDVIVDDVKENLVVISPDAGSNKKIYSLVQKLELKNVVRCDKLRDVSNGKIIDSVVYADDLTGKTCLIVDDIISGGMTYKILAKKLKEKNAHRVYLVISHCEGRADLDSLKNSGIDGMFTTNSKPWNVNDYNKDNFIVEFDVEQYLKC